MSGIKKFVKLADDFSVCVKYWYPRGYSSGIEWIIEVRYPDGFDAYYDGKFSVVNRIANGIIEAYKESPKYALLKVKCFGLVNGFLSRI